MAEQEGVYMVCQGCRQLSFYAWQDKRTGEITISCANCKRELLRSMPEGD